MKIDEIILGGTKKRLHRDPRKRRHVRDDNLYDVNLSDLSETELDEVIRKMGDQFRLYSKKGKNLGTYDSRAGAEKREKQVNYFKHMSEGYKIQLERADDMYILHILDTETNKRTEVRGKSDYETTGYDANDKLHQLLDKIGKSANISELINGEVVTINPKHPDAEKAKAATDVAFNEAKEIEPDPEGYRKTALTAPANTLVIDTKSDLDWYKLGQYISNPGMAVGAVTSRPAASESKSTATSSSTISPASTQEAFDFNGPSSTATKVDADDDLESFLNDLDL